MRIDANNIPFAPRRLPFFYGWVILAMGAIGFLMSAPGQTYGVAPFTNPLLGALGVSRVQLSLAYMFGTIGSSFCLTYAGRLYDRWGARVVGPGSSLVLGCVLVTLSQCDRIAAVLSGLIHAVSRAHVAMVLMVLLFFLLRFSGQGVLTIVSRNMTMKWFDRHRGLVTAVMGMVIAPAFSAMPSVLNSLVEAVGWRAAWLWLALLIGGVFSVAALIFYRDNPEDCGLVPDGPLANRALGSRRDTSRARVQFTLQEARATYSFWIFSLSLALFGLYMTAWSFHAASVFEIAGLVSARGYRIFLYAALASLVLRPFVGWLCDRVPLKYLLMMLLFGMCVSSLGLSCLAPGLSRLFVVAGSGIAGASIGTVVTVTWADFFGRKHLGAISGLNMSITVFASALGPWLFSQNHALTGDYRVACLVVAAVAAILFVLSFRAENPQEARA